MPGYWGPRILREKSYLTKPLWTGIHLIFIWLGMRKSISQPSFKKNVNGRFVVWPFSRPPQTVPNEVHDRSVFLCKNLLVGTPNHHAFAQELHRIRCIRIQIIQRTDRIPSTVPIKELLELRRFRSKRQRINDEWFRTSAPQKKVGEVDAMWLIHKSKGTNMNQPSS